jgi:hypothetical protein
VTPITASDRVKRRDRLGSLIHEYHRTRRGRFDVVMSQFRVMFFDEPIVAFTNVVKHLRSGGRLGFACWQTLDRNPWFVGPVLAAFVAPLHRSHVARARPDP